MQVVIDIPDNYFSGLHQIQNGSIASKIILNCVKNGTPLPKGATNGDRIKVIFPDCKDWKAKIEDNNGEVYEVHFVQLPNSMAINKYEESWWNTPYKAESEDKE